MNLSTLNLPINPPAKPTATKIYATILIQQTANVSLCQAVKLVNDNPKVLESPFEMVDLLCRLKAR